MKNKQNSGSYPLITIGITCYNAADTIERAIRSAVTQDWPHKEIIIVDDCSNDSSAAIVQNAIKEVPFATLIKHYNNLGVAGSRQTILENATGEFLAFFDDDDESMAERLSTQYDRITGYEQKTGESLIACYASGYRDYSNGYKVPLHAIGSQPEIPHGPRFADYSLFYRKQPGWFYGAGTPTCSLMARVETYKKAGGFDIDFRRVEDLDFAIRLALLGGHFIGCPERLFIQYATTAKDKAPEVNLQAEQKLAIKHKAYLDQVNFYHYALIWPKIRYYHHKSQYFRMGITFFLLFLRHPLKAITHIMDTGPKRLIHEWKMNRKRKS